MKKHIKELEIMQIIATILVSEPKDLIHEEKLNVQMITLEERRERAPT